MSQRTVPFPSPSRGLVTPRWSVAGQFVFDPRSMAGLPESSACVLVDPPLLSSGPRRGFPLSTAEPTKTAPLVSPMKFLP
jgi:hypothetical protein